MALREKLNCFCAGLLTASAASATLIGNSANAEKLNAETPNHCLTEPDFALDFIAQ
ncbi:hypothetical protein V5O39_18695 [Pseudomonas parakoreensis]